MTLELQKPRPIWQIMFSTHHTDVGLLYLISSLTFLFLGGSLALGIRAELFLPGSQIIADSMTFNRIFTVHGTTLIFYSLFHLHQLLVTITFQLWLDTRIWLILNLMQLHFG